MYQQNPYNQGVNNSQYMPPQQYYSQPAGYSQQQQQQDEYQGGMAFPGGQQQQQSVLGHVDAVKEIERSAMFTFSPCGPYIAAGSVAGAIDLSFSTSSQLEVR
jgi:hypothetical protein